MNFNFTALGLLFLFSSSSCTFKYKNNLKSLALFIADSFLPKKYEGGAFDQAKATYLQALEKFSKFTLGESKVPVNQEFKKTILEIKSFVEDSFGVKDMNKAKAKIKKLKHLNDGIRELRGVLDTNNTMLLELGFPKHLMLMQIIRLRSTYLVLVFNSGAGIEYHYKKIVNYVPKSCPVLTFSVPKEDFEDDLEYWLKAVKELKLSTDKELNQDTLYNALFQDPFHLEKDYSKFDYIHGQLGGTCSTASFHALAHFHLSRFNTDDGQLGKKYFQVFKSLASFALLRDAIEDQNFLFLDSHSNSHDLDVIQSSNGSWYKFENLDPDQSLNTKELPDTDVFMNLQWNFGLFDKMLKYTVKKIGSGLFDESLDKSFKAELESIQAKFNEKNLKLRFNYEPKDKLYDNGLEVGAASVKDKKYSRSYDLDMTNFTVMKPKDYLKCSLPILEESLKAFMNALYNFVRKEQSSISCLGNAPGAHLAMLLRIAIIGYSKVTADWKTIGDDDAERYFEIILEFFDYCLNLLFDKNFRSSPSAHEKFILMDLLIRTNILLLRRTKLSRNHIFGKYVLKMEYSSGFFDYYSLQLFALDDLKIQLDRKLISSSKHSIEIYHKDIDFKQIDYLDDFKPGKCDDSTKYAEDSMTKQFLKALEDGKRKFKYFGDTEEKIGAYWRAKFDYKSQKRSKDTYGREEKLYYGILKMRDDLLSKIKCKIEFKFEPDLFKQDLTYYAAVITELSSIPDSHVSSEENEMICKIKETGNRWFYEVKSAKKFAPTVLMYRILENQELIDLVEFRYATYLFYFEGDIGMEQRDASSNFFQEISFKAMVSLNYSVSSIQLTRSIFLVLVWIRVSTIDDRDKFFRTFEVNFGLLQKISPSLYSFLKLSAILERSKAQSELPTGAAEQLKSLYASVVQNYRDIEIHVPSWEQVARLNKLYGHFKSIFGKDSECLIKGKDLLTNFLSGLSFSKGEWVKVTSLKLQSRNSPILQHLIHTISDSLEVQYLKNRKNSVITAFRSPKIQHFASKFYCDANNCYIAYGSEGIYVNIPNDEVDIVFKDSAKGIGIGSLESFFSPDSKSKVFFFYSKSKNSLLVQNEGLEIVADLRFTPLACKLNISTFFDGNYAFSFLKHKGFDKSNIYGMPALQYYQEHGVVLNFVNYNVPLIIKRGNSDTFIFLHNYSKGEVKYFVKVEGGNVYKLLIYNGSKKNKSWSEYSLRLAKDFPLYRIAIPALLLNDQKRDRGIRGGGGGKSDQKGRVVEKSMVSFLPHPGSNFSEIVSIKTWKITELHNGLESLIKYKFLPATNTEILTLVYWFNKHKSYFSAFKFAQKLSVPANGFSGEEDRIISKLLDSMHPDVESLRIIAQALLLRHNSDIIKHGKSGGLSAEVLERLLKLRGLIPEYMKMESPYLVYNFLHYPEGKLLPCQMKEVKFIPSMERSVEAFIDPPEIFHDQIIVSDGKYCNEVEANGTKKKIPLNVLEPSNLFKISDFQKTMEFIESNIDDAKSIFKKYFKYAGFVKDDASRKLYAVAKVLSKVEEKSNTFKELKRLLELNDNVHLDFFEKINQLYKPPIPISGDKPPLPKDDHDFVIDELIPLNEIEKLNALDIANRAKHTFLTSKMDLSLKEFPSEVDQIWREIKQKDSLLLKLLECFTVECVRVKFFQKTDPDPSYITNLYTQAWKYFIYEKYCKTMPDLKETDSRSIASLCDSSSPTTTKFSFKNRAIVILEYVSKYILKDHQYKSLKFIIKKLRETKRNIIYQKMMGGGKTSVFGTFLFPFISRFLGKIPVFVFPNQILNQNIKLLRSRLKRMFGKNPFVLKMDRGPKFINLSYMKFLQLRIAEVFLNGDYIICAPETIQSLQNAVFDLIWKARKLHDLGDGQDKNQSYNLTLKALQDILKYMQQNSIMIIDEIDTVFRPTKTLNYNGVEEREILPLQKKFVQVLVFALVQRMKTTQKSVGAEDVDEIVLGFIESAKSGNGDKLIYDITDGTYKLTNPEIISIIDTIKNTMTKISNVHFGLSKINRATQPFVIPFSGVNCPNEGSAFSSFWQTYSLTIRYYLENGFDSSYVESILKHFHDLALKQIQQLYDNDPDILPEKVFSPLANQFKEMFGFDLFQYTKNDLKQFKTSLHAKDSIKMIVLEIMILPHITTYQHEIVNPPLEFANFSSRLVGYSGTIYNKDIYPKDPIINDDEGVEIESKIFFSFSTYGLAGLEIKDLGLTESQTKHASNKKKLKEELNWLLGEKYSALIDAGAVFKDFSNQEIAKYLVAQMKESSETFAVIYFDDDRGIMVYRTNTNNEISEVPESDHYTNIGVSYLFAYYDQTHCVGVDIKFEQDAKGVVTVSDFLDKKFFLQALLRMRQLLEGIEKDVDGKGWSPNQDVKRQTISIMVLDMNSLKKRPAGNGDEFDKEIKIYEQIKSQYNGSSVYKEDLDKIIQNLCVNQLIDRDLENSMIPKHAFYSHMNNQILQNLDPNNINEKFVEEVSWIYYHEIPVIEEKGVIEPKDKIIKFKELKKGEKDGFWENVFLNTNDLIKDFKTFRDTDSVVMVQVEMELLAQTELQIQVELTQQGFPDGLGPNSTERPLILLPQTEEEVLCKGYDDFKVLTSRRFAYTTKNPAIHLVSRYRKNGIFMHLFDDDKLAFIDLYEANYSGAEPLCLPLLQYFDHSQQSQIIKYDADKLLNDFTFMGSVRGMKKFFDLFHKKDNSEAYKKFENYISQPKNIDLLERFVQLNGNDKKNMELLAASDTSLDYLKKLGMSTISKFFDKIEPEKKIEELESSSSELDSGDEGVTPDKVGESTKDGYREEGHHLFPVYIAVGLAIVIIALMILILNIFFLKTRN